MKSKGSSAWVNTVEPIVLNLQRVSRPGDRSQSNVCCAQQELYNIGRFEGTKEGIAPQNLPFAPAIKVQQYPLQKV